MAQVQFVCNPVVCYIVLDVSVFCVFRKLIFTSSQFTGCGSKAYHDESAYSEK